MKTNEMKESQALRQAQRQQMKEYQLEAFSLRSALFACVRANRVPTLVPFYEKAGAPAQNASNSEIEKWAFREIRQMLPYYTTENGEYKQATTTRDATKATKFTEKDEATIIHNVVGVKSETLQSCTTGALHIRLFYTERQTKTPQFIPVRYPDGTTHDVPEYDKNGKRVYKHNTVRDYITEGAGKYSIRQVATAFLQFIGVPAAIAAAEAEEAAYRAAMQVLRAAKAAEQAQYKAAAATSCGQDMQQKASEKYKKALEIQDATGMSVEKACEVLSAHALESKQADEQAATAPQGCRQKANTRTPASKVVNK